MDFYKVDHCSKGGGPVVHLTRVNYLQLNYSTVTAIDWETVWDVFYLLTCGRWNIHEYCNIWDTDNIVLEILYVQKYEENLFSLCPTSSATDITSK